MKMSLYRKRSADELSVGKCINYFCKGKVRHNMHGVKGKKKLAGETCVGKAPFDNQ
jgi:hypothetical protein